MAKTNSEKRPANCARDPELWTVLHPRKVAGFHTERRGGKPSARSTQCGQRRLSEVTFLAEATAARPLPDRRAAPDLAAAGESLARRACPRIGVCHRFCRTPDARFSDDIVKPLRWILHGENQFRKRPANCGSDPELWTVLHPRKVAGFHTERRGGKPSSCSTQCGQRRLSEVTFLAEATRPADLIVADQYDNEATG